MRRYENIYNKIIERAKTRKLDSFTSIEVHHIIPKSLGGSDDKSNLVVLTLKEHFIVHLLLTKIYPNEPKMIRAFLIMCRKNPNKSAESFKILKENVKNLMSKQSLEYHSNPSNKEKFAQYSIDNWKNSEYREKQALARNNYITDKYREQRSKAAKKLHEDPEFSKMIFKSIEKHANHKSQEWIDKITIINKKRANSPEFKKLASSNYKGSNFDNRRKVLDINTNIVYDSAMDAANAKGLKYEVVKKWLYKGIPKHNLIWLNDKEGEVCG